MFDKFVAEALNDYRRHQDVADDRIRDGLDYEYRGLPVAEAALESAVWWEESATQDIVFALRLLAKKKLMQLSFEQYWLND